MMKDSSSCTSGDKKLQEVGGTRERPPEPEIGAGGEGQCRQHLV